MPAPSKFLLLDSSSCLFVFQPNAIYEIRRAHVHTSGGVWKSLERRGGDWMRHHPNLRQEQHAKWFGSSRTCQDDLSRYRQIQRALHLYFCLRAHGGYFDQPRRARLGSNREKIGQKIAGSGAASGLRSGPPFSRSPSGGPPWPGQRTKGLKQIIAGLDEGFCGHAADCPCAWLWKTRQAGDLPRRPDRAPRPHL